MSIAKHLYVGNFAAFCCVVLRRMVTIVGWSQVFATPTQTPPVTVVVVVVRGVQGTVV